MSVSILSAAAGLGRRGPRPGPRALVADSEEPIEKSDPWNRISQLRSLSEFGSSIDTAENTSKFGGDSIHLVGRLASAYITETVPKSRRIHRDGAYRIRGVRNCRGSLMRTGEDFLFYALPGISDPVNLQFATRNEVPSR